VVYPIRCKECHHIYVGQTGRQLKDRVKEHERAVRRGDRSNACAKHTLENGHELDLGNVHVIHYEKNMYTRLTLESFSIAANHSRVMNISAPNLCMKKWCDVFRGGVQV